MPFSLLIMAGPSTIRTSATMESGICRATPEPAALAADFGRRSCRPAVRPSAEPRQ